LIREETWFVTTVRQASLDDKGRQGMDMKIISLFCPATFLGKKRHRWSVFAYQLRRDKQRKQLGPCRDSGWAFRPGRVARAERKTFFAIPAFIPIIKRPEGAVVSKPI
jgi:hypothetical protein